MKLALYPKYLIRRLFARGKKRFFRAGYRFLYPEYSQHGMSPWQHYVIDGRRKGFCDGNCPPDTVFFPEGYVLEYPDVKAAGIDPWHHYVQNGFSEKRDNGLNPPPELFFAAGYLAMYPDVAESKEEPWHHYVLKGKAEGRDNGLHPDEKRFFAEGYLAMYPDAVGSGIDPWHHYAGKIRAENRDNGLHPDEQLFFAEGYLAMYPEVVESNEDPWHHYVLSGKAEGRDNGLHPDIRMFFAPGYLAMYPEVAESGIDAWHHYILKGKAEGRGNGFPKVSVVIPVYNVERYLRECLESVVNQTLKPIEIICVNDGSTDGSLGILNEYAERDARVSVISQTNQGAGAARNAGLEVAVGTYLAVLDADDRYDLSLLEKLLRLAQQNNLDIAVCRSQQLDNRAGNVFATPWTIHEEMLPKKKVFSYRDLSSYVFRFSIGWSWDKLFRRDFVERNKLRFQTLRSQNDALFVFVSLAMAERIAVLNEVLVTHRVNTGTQVSELRDRNPGCFILAVRGIKQALEERGRFSEVEQGFDNWCAEHTNWQLSTLSPSSQLFIYYDLVNMLSEIKLLEKPAEFFDAKQDELLKKKLRNMKRCIALLTPKPN